MLKQLKKKEMQKQKMPRRQGHFKRLFSFPFVFSDKGVFTRQSFVSVPREKGAWGVRDIPPAPLPPGEDPGELSLRIFRLPDRLLPAECRGIWKAGAV